MPEQCGTNSPRVFRDILAKEEDKVQPAGVWWLKRRFQYERWPLLGRAQMVGQWRAAGRDFTHVNDWIGGFRPTQYYVMRRRKPMNRRYVSLGIGAALILMSVVGSRSYVIERRFTHFAVDTIEREIQSILSLGASVGW